MEKLQRRSDGIAETLSGLFAISPKRTSGSDEQFNWFDYRRTAVAPITRVRWPRGETIAVIEAPVANFMLHEGYARQVSDDEILEWNERIDELDLDAPNPQPVEVIDNSAPEFMRGNIDAAQMPSGAQTPGTAPNIAAHAQNALAGQDLANSGTPAAEGSAPATEAGEQGGEQQSEGGEGGSESDTDAPTEGEGSSAGEKSDEQSGSAEDGKGSEGTTQPAGKKKAQKGLL